MCRRKIDRSSVALLANSLQLFPMSNSCDLLVKLSCIAWSLMSASSRLCTTFAIMVNTCPAVHVR